MIFVINNKSIGTIGVGGTTTIYSYDLRRVEVKPGKEAIVAKFHDDEATPQVVNVCYGTSVTPPSIELMPEGTLYIQYIA